MNILQKLKEVTTVVADSGDVTAITQYSPQDVTTNPSLLLRAVNLPEYAPLIREALEYARQQGGSERVQLMNATDKLAVNIGAALLSLVPGKVSTEIDARLSYDRGLCVAKARKIIRLYEMQGISRSKVLIKLASTWQGIQAAQELEREGIHCNMTLIFSFAQARACAEAGVWLISPFVGRITDWYQQHQPERIGDHQDDPGVQSVKRIYDYYKRHRYPTIIMGASFRHIGQVIALAGCDRLTIAPPLLEQLRLATGDLSVLLHPPVEGEIPPSPLTEAEFLWEHHQDPMAVDKLSEGIRQFARDQEKLEALLMQEINAMQTTT